MMDAALRELVRQRAGNRCEYCRLHQHHSPFVLQIEHIVARKHGGNDDSSNLALACDRCNLHKGSDLTGIDPETNQIVALFHPRTQSWIEHFTFLKPIARTIDKRDDLNLQDAQFTWIFSSESVDQPKNRTELHSLQ
jgi:hypothetical protein